MKENKIGTTLKTVGAVVGAAVIAVIVRALLPKHDRSHTVYCQEDVGELAEDDAVEEDTDEDIPLF